MKLIYIFIILLSTSCVTQKRCAEKFPDVASHDSIYIEKLDTVKIILPGDSVKIETKVPCNDFELMTENGKLRQEIKVINGKLSQIIRVKPDTIYHHTTSTITKIQTVKVPEKVKFVPRIVKIFAGIGLAFTVGLIVYLYLKLK
jgi:hypothetical protein